MDVLSSSNGASAHLVGNRGVGRAHGRVEPVLGLRSNPRSYGQPRPQDCAEHGEAALEGARYRTGTVSPATDDMGTVSSESLGHPCRCRFLHHRNLDSRGSGYVLRLVRDSAEDPPGPYLDTHTKAGPSLHETSSARTLPRSTTSFSEATRTSSSTEIRNTQRSFEKS